MEEVETIHHALAFSLYMGFQGIYPILVLLVFGLYSVKSAMAYILIDQRQAWMGKVKHFVWR